MWPTGQSGQGVGPVAGRIRLLGVGNLNPDARHGLATLQHTSGYAISGRVADAHQHRGAAFAALHVADRAANPIFAGDGPSPANHVGVGGDDCVVSEVPRIGQRVAVRIGGIGREDDGGSREGGGGTGREGNTRELIVGELAQIHLQVERFWDGSAFGQRGDVDAGHPVGKGSADEQRRVVLAVGGAGRDVEQERLLVAGAGPAQSNAVHQGGPVGELLAEL